MHAIGIDIGGTKIAGAVVTEDGQIVAEDRVATEAGDPQQSSTPWSHMIQKLSLGQSDRRRGRRRCRIHRRRAVDRLLHAQHRVAQRAACAHRSTERLDLAVTIENDANAAGWAEFRFGAGRDVHDMMMLTIGTGVGGAIVSQGELFRGGFGAGAELGHMRVVPDGLPVRLRRRTDASSSTGRVARCCAWRTRSRMPAASASRSPLPAREHGELDGSIVGASSRAGDPGAVARARAARRLARARRARRFERGARPPGCS